MANDCNIKNPLRRDGASQSKRILKALKPSYIKVDERDLDDLLVFIRKYAEKVQYYNLNNEPDGDWKNFIENDISTIVSEIAQKDITDIKSCIKFDLTRISKASTLNNLTKASFYNLFRHVFYICDELNTWYKRSKTGLKLNTELKQIITSQLSDNLKTVVSAYKYALSKNYFYDNASEACKLLIYTDDFLSSNLNIIWITQSSTSNSKWSDYLQSIPDTDNYLFGATGTHIKKVKTASEKLEGIIDRFIGAQARLIKQSPDYLKETLENYSSHEPHMALFLAFLQLFKYAQDDLNKITKRHLDFYYKKVLRLKTNDETPDTVHVIFELAKQVDSYLIKKGTQLKAGKDNTGVEVIYEVDEDTVFNKASVDKLKTVFIDKSDNYRVYSAPIANSIDGIGGALDDDEPKWKTFGESQKSGNTYLDEDERSMQFSTIGFAITSPILFLSQGKRTITVTFNVSGNLSSLLGKESLIKNALAFYISGEEEWITASLTSVTIDSGSGTLTFEIELAQECSATYGFNSGKLTDEFDTDFPVLKVILTNSTSSDYIYGDLKQLTISKVSLDTTVKLLKNIILQNDAGLLKTNKPFYPFTTNPGIDSSFYIGSKEIFQKKVTEITLNIEWKDVPDSKLEDYYTNLLSITDNESFKVSADVLVDNEWESVSKSESLFIKDAAQSAKSIVLSFKSTGTQKIEYYADLIDGELTEYIAALQRGFLRLVLKEPAGAFGHKDYRDKYTKAIIKYAKSATDENKNAIPNEPYTAYVNNFWVDYDATEEIDVKASSSYKTDESKFYHIYPFGIKEVRTSSSSNVDLLPQFEFSNSAKKYESEGELYIGIKNLDPPQNLSLLFQLAEGSADPEAPEQVVYWSYLYDNEWVEFEDTDIISDTTSGLVKSGIIKFSVPSDATSDNIILPGGYHWIRATVDDKSNAVCDTLEVIAQAVKATYKNESNDPDFLANVLSAKTITKLSVKDSSVKKVTQPYASLGGKVKEDSEKFYTRVSERLRHKNRGISIWDYEKLILQEFPLIFKVKCINHSTYSGSNSEFAPGYVSVIVVPNLYNKNSVNPLEPRTSVGELKSIKEYLQKRISVFAADNLEVLNPLYEKIKVEFQVEFKKGYDWGFYKSKLHDDIIEYLSPWAYKDGEDIMFGGKIHRSVILNFVEERDYVDYVAEFKMIQIVDVDNTQKLKYTEEAECTTARSILVSNSEHDIKQVVSCE